MGSSGGSSGMSATEQRMWNLYNYNLSKKNLKLQEEAQQISQQELAVAAESLAAQNKANELAQTQTDIAQQAEKQQEAANRLAERNIVEPARAVASLNSQTDSTVRAENLRHGIGSAFSRSTVGRVGSYSPTGGTSTKLGQ